MIWWVNLISNVVLLSACLWAVLNQRIDTKIVGTLALSSLGIFAALNLLKLREVSGQGDESQAMVNASVACLFVWLCLRYQRFLGKRPAR